MKFEVINNQKSEGRKLRLQKELDNFIENMRLLSMKSSNLIALIINKNERKIDK